MRKRALTLLLLAGCGGSLPRPEFERFDPAVTPNAADYPDVAAVILLDRGTLQLTVDAVTRNPLGRLTHLRRYKVLREGGEETSTIVIPYDPGSIVAGLMVRKVFPNGDIESVGTKYFFDGAHESGRRAKIVKVPDVRPDVIVEYTYDVYIQDVRFLPPWVFETIFPVVRSEYAVNAPRGFSVDLRFSREGAFVERPPERFDSDEGTRYFWSEANLPARFSEPGMPSAGLMSPRAHVIFLGANVGGGDRPGFAAWEDVAAWFVSRVPNWTKLDPSTIAEAKRLAGETSPEEKALKLQTIVARDLGWESGPQLPLWMTRMVHPDIVLKEKRGNATSRGLLLVALLRAIGIPALPALVAYRDRGVLLPDLPNAYELDAVAAVVPRTQGPLVLDPSQLTVSADVPPPRLQGARIVVLHEEGAEVITVPTSQPADSRTSLAYDLKLDVRGDLFGTMEARLTGAEAGMLRQQLLAADPGSYADIVSAFIKERGGGIPVESASIADLTELRRPLGVKATVSVKKAVMGEGTSLAVVLGKIVGSEGARARLREVRRTPLKIGAPRDVEIIATISMPEDYEPEQLLPAFSEKWEGGEVSIKMRQEGQRRIGIVRRGTLRVLEVKPQQYGDYRRFREALAAVEERSFTIKRPAPRSVEY